jgi:uncharacterized coiled-coil protein SlyX
MNELNLNIDSLNLLKLEKTGRFENAVAYSGAVIFPKDMPQGLIIDLSKTKISKSVPLLFSHQPYDVAGITENTAIENNALLASGQLAINNEFADEIKSKSDWQLSIGVFANQSETLADGEERLVNGITVTAPTTIWSDAHVKEISVTHYPVDTNTKIQFFSNEETNMTDAVELLKQQLAERDAEIVTLKATIAERDATIADLNAQITAMQAAANEAKLSYRKEQIAKFSQDKGVKPEDFNWMLNLSHDDDFAKALQSFETIKPSLPEHMQKLSNDFGTDENPTAKTGDYFINKYAQQLGALNDYGN